MEVSSDGRAALFKRDNGGKEMRSRLPPQGDAVVFVWGVATGIDVEQSADPAIEQALAAECRTPYHRYPRCSRRNFDLPRERSLAATHTVDEHIQTINYLRPIVVELDTARGAVFSVR